MKVLVLAVHPNMEQSVVNKTFVEELKGEPDITVRELYQEYPDEVIDVEKEQRLLEEHDRIVFQFPLYWYSSPPLLKKWLDHVLLYGWAYGTNGTALRGKEFMVAVSAGAPEEAYQAGGSNHYSISELLRPFQATSNFVGATYLPPHVFYGAGSIGESALAESAKTYREHILKSF
ncbi:NAD(P)H-dependent oxidoreductase [Bacillus sonorensis]|uniref:NAD(P)H oxidoreductase YwrO n=2 Tax=Bacillus sonorensis TaxID=119858 RepID=M5NZF8_9BACI|nr:MULTISPECIES: NAD(P)H-dependent oxidoreductase [Bacillus]TWK79540.1 General stress protein 14 [Bacillus paralicheniformis]ASB87257.1 General stress protein [Bacillus sonorensis]EME73261.1 NAD(P)H oxidoreductase YwrO [Bacillus sonorensis L12]MBG9914254.1 general stress protein [Bacillus sonorensis]MCF7616504.1 NAD(P)H-dependent oxidoreductase [Bacillus sonorensis]